MNSWELLEALQNGAALRRNYVPRTTMIGKPKIAYYLKYPDGTVTKIQASCVKPLLKSGKVTAIEWSGGMIDYVLKKES